MYTKTVSGFTIGQWVHKKIASFFVSFEGVKFGLLLKHLECDYTKVLNFLFSSIWFVLSQVFVQEKLGPVTEYQQ